MIQDSALSPKQIRSHLLQCNRLFLNELKSRADLDVYSEKLSSRAELLHVSERGRVIALLAYYVDEVKSEAFVSNVSVIREFEGRGLAKNLLQTLESRISSENRTGIAIRLEVLRLNERAIRLYRSLGYDFDSPQIGKPLCEMRKAL